MSRNALDHIKTTMATWPALSSPDTPAHTCISCVPIALLFGHEPCTIHVPGALSFPTSIFAPWCNHRTWLPGMAQHSDQALSHSCREGVTWRMTEGPVLRTVDNCDAPLQRQAGSANTSS